MEIRAFKIVTKDNLHEFKFTFTHEDDGKDDFTIVRDTIAFGLAKKLTAEQELQINILFKKKGMKILKDKNGKIKYFDRGSNPSGTTFSMDL
jgi:hypothetical protein